MGCCEETLLGLDLGEDFSVGFLVGIFGGLFFCWKTATKIKSVQTRGIGIKQVDLQGVFVKIGDFIEFKEFLLWNS